MKPLNKKSITIMVLCCTVLLFIPYIAIHFSNSNSKKINANNNSSTVESTLTPTVSPSVKKKGLTYYGDSHDLKKGQTIYFNINIPTKYLKKQIKCELIDIDSDNSELVYEDIAKETLSLEKTIVNDGRYFFNVLCDNKNITKFISFTDISINVPSQSDSGMQLLK